MPYNDIAEAVRLVNRGNGSLVMSLFTYDPDVTRAVLTGVRRFPRPPADRGSRLCAENRPATARRCRCWCMAAPAAPAVAKRLGGIRGVMHYMQRTALQGSPRMLAR